MCKALQVFSNLVIRDFMVVRLVGFGIRSLTLLWAWSSHWVYVGAREVHGLSYLDYRARTLARGFYLWFLYIRNPVFCNAWHKALR